MSSPLFFSVLCLFVFFNPATSVKCIKSAKFVGDGDPMELATKELAEMIKPQLPAEIPADLNDKGGSASSDSDDKDDPLAALAAMFGIAIATGGKKYAADDCNCCSTGTMRLTQTEGVFMSMHACLEKCSPDACFEDFCNKRPGDTIPTGDYEESDVAKMQKVMADLMIKAGAKAMTEKYGPSEKLTNLLKKIEKAAEDVFSTTPAYVEAGPQYPQYPHRGSSASIKFEALLVVLSANLIF